MPDQPRPVWPTLADRNALLQAAGFCAQMEGLADVLRRMAAAWDAAPADAAEAVESRLEYAEMNCDVIAVTHIALRALGRPD